jgi:hypothetical protein
LARRRQIYLVKCADGGAGSGRPRQGSAGAAQLIPLGELKDLIPRMAPYNTAPDGAGPEGLGENVGMALLYGPGYTLEMPTTSDEVGQAIVTLLDEDIAWSVLGRMCKAEGWMMMDPETGRTFGG